MEVQLTPEIQAKLDRLSGETGRKRKELVRDALAGYFDELAQVRGLLDSRYDDLKSGRVALLSGEQVAMHFSKKECRPPLVTEYAFHPEALNDLDEIWEFLTDDNVDAANRIVAQLLATCENLSRLPHQGHHHPELSSRSLRFTVVREYLPAYAPEARPL